MTFASASFVSPAQWSEHNSSGPLEGLNLKELSDFQEHHRSRDDALHSGSEELPSLPVFQCTDSGTVISWCVESLVMSLSALLCSGYCSTPDRFPSFPHLFPHHPLPQMSRRHFGPEGTGA